MKIETYHKVKPVAHYALLSISIALSVGLFTSFSEKIIYKIIWAGLAVIFEVIKDMSISETKTFLKNHKELSVWVKILRAGISFIPYLGFATISLIASAGFALNTIQAQSFAAQATNEVIESQIVDDTIYDFTIDTLESQIIAQQDERTEKVRQMNEQGGDYYTGSGLLSTQIDDIDAEISRLIAERQSYVEKKTELTAEKNDSIADTLEDRELVAIDTFTLLGEEIGMSGEDVMKSLMYFLALLLETFTGMTAMAFTGKEKGSVDRRKLKIYIDELFNTDGKRLNTDKVIEKNTILSPNECRMYKDFLMNTKHKGVPLIEMGRGIGTKANFNKDATWQIADVKNRLS